MNRPYCPILSSSNASGINETQREASAKELHGSVNVEVSPDNRPFELLKKCLCIAGRPNSIKQEDWQYVRLGAESQMRFAGKDKGRDKKPDGD